MGHTKPGRLLESQGMSTLAHSPSAEDQLTFLSKLQRLFSEGDFTATYKFALLIALADLAVERGDDTAAPMTLTLRDIAARFIALYWNHVAPFGGLKGAQAAGMLSQNLGAQAAVLSAIADFRRQTNVMTIGQAIQAASYPALLSKVVGVVSAQPVSYLQNFGGVTDQFLYERSGPGRLKLKPGAAFCLRRFYPLVQQLARSHWVGHIKSNNRNQQLLGKSSDLEAFLFSTSRQSLAALGAQLRKLDGPRCFYCGHTLEEHEVDHFIPFSMYPRDLPANFVLAHPRCNRSKSDSLAAKEHLERWVERLVHRASALHEIGDAAGLVDEPNTIHRVAAWSYSAALRARSRAWKAPSIFEQVDDTYLAMLNGPLFVS